MEAEKARSELQKAKDPAMKAFLDTFCSKRDTTEILSDLLVCEGTNDIFKLQEKVQNL